VHSTRELTRKRKFSFRYERRVHTASVYRRGLLHFPCYKRVKLPWNCSH